MSKLIYAKSKAGFETAYDLTARSLGGTVYASVVFTEDGYLFTHGKYFRIFPDAATIFTSTTTNGTATLKDTTAAAKTLGTIDVGVTAVVGGNALSNTALSNGSITIDHDVSGVAAAAYGPTGDSVGATATIPKVTVDTYGHVTAAGTHTATLNRVLATTTTGNFYLLGHASSTDVTNSAQALKIATIYGNQLGHLTAVKFIGATDKSLSVALNGAVAVAFNNTADVTHTFFAPTTGGTAGQILKSNGNSAPTWLSLSESIAVGSTNSEVPTAAAVYAAISSGISTNDAMIFKGVIDASTNPNYPASDKGWTWKISAPGKIGGASGVVVEAGDTIICTTDGSVTGDQATVGTNWTILQTNIDGSVTTTGVLAQNALVLGTGTAAIQSLANSTAGNILVCGGGTTAPSWNAPGAFTIQVNDAAFGTNYSPTSGKTVNFKPGSNVTLASSGNDITISSTDSNWYPTAFSWTGGTSAGPTGSLTGAGMTAVAVGAIPVASATASGVVTTGAQIFAGTKTFSSIISGSINGTAALATDVAGGTTGAIVYQSAAGVTAFLAASATNGYVLKYNTTTNAPYWAADVDTDTHYTSKNIIGATAGATANATAANAALYLNHIENGSVTSTHKITGAGATSVASDASGNLTITSANTWRNVSAYSVTNTFAQVLTSTIGTDDLQFGSEFIWDTVGDGTNGPELKLGWAEIDNLGAITYMF